jgi:beta-glucosidase-like glycosyl hydrolase
MRSTLNSFAIALVFVSAACSSGGNQMTGTGGSLPAGAAGAMWMPGTGNTAGGLGGGGTGGGRAFPTQACLTKATDVLAMMTSDEKLAQLHQVERANTNAADITKYDVGSVYSQGGSGPSTNTPTGWADMIDGFRTAAYASRLRIPVIYGLDVVHGVGPVKGATVFPHNIGLGASRDPALVQDVAQAVAEEAVGVGADFPFAPVVAVSRDIRWGRTYESFGETVELASAMGVAYTNGFQKASGGFTVLANAKHYLGDGGTLGGVNNGDTSGDETALRALHLTPYQAVVGAGVGSIMASYSSWQGVRMHANTAMITGTLKGDLGFAGFVGSDYNGCYQNGVTPAGCLNAGVDMFMTFGKTASAFLNDVRPLVPSTVPQSRIDDAARRILVVKCEMGLLDGTQKLVDRTLTAQIGSDAHRAVARRAVAASMVVLKNENNTLPLAKDVTGIALGHLAGHERQRHHRRHHHAPGAGGRRAQPRLLRAGRLGDRQRRRHGRHRRHRRDAVLRRVRRHPEPAGRHELRGPAEHAQPRLRRRAGGGKDEGGGPEDRGGAGGGPADDPQPDPRRGGRHRGGVAARHRGRRRHRRAVRRRAPERQVAALVAAQHGSDSDQPGRRELRSAVPLRLRVDVLGAPRNDPADL